MIIWWRGWGLLALLPLPWICFAGRFGNSYFGATGQMLFGYLTIAVIAAGGTLLYGVDRRRRRLDPESIPSDDSLFWIPLRVYAVLYWLLALVLLVVAIAYALIA